MGDARSLPLDAGSRQPWWGMAGLLMLVLLMAMVGALTPFTLLEDSFGLRLWYHSRGAVAAPQDVVIVALESRASKALNVPNRPDRWPRRLHAELVRGLTAGQAAAVLFDLQFDRPREPADDQALAAALRESGRVLLGTYMLRDRQTPPQLPGITLNVDQLLEPLPVLAQAAYATGPFPLPKTQYGMRDFWLFVPSAGDEPSLALQAAALLQPEKYRALYAKATGETVTTPLSSAQLRRLTRVLPLKHAFKLYGPPGTVTTITYDQALARLRDPADHGFKDKVVLVGFSEFNQPENRDAYTTAYSNQDGLEMSGVELMATAVANVLHDDWLVTPSPLWNAALLLALGVLVVLPWWWGSATRALLLNAAVLAGYLWLGSVLFQRNVWLPLIAPLALQFPVLAGAGLLWRHRRNQQNLLLLRHTFNRYLPGAAVQQVLQAHRNLSGDIEVVCLCADIAGYTSVSESLPPHALRQWLNRYFTAVIKVIGAHGGHVVDLTGDALLALWVQAPDPQAASQQALQAALALQSLERELDAPLRIGLHRGPIAFGEVGAAAHLELRAVGDTVNTTSRLQGANKQIGTRVLVSAEVAQCLADASQADTRQLRRLGSLQLAGKQQPVAVYTLAHSSAQAWDELRILDAK